MCFGGGGGTTYPQQPTNPAPYTPRDSYKAVKETTTPDNTTKPKDTTTETPSGPSSVSSGVNTSGLGM